jgi:hypothetical protein
VAQRRVHDPEGEGADEAGALGDADDGLRRHVARGEVAPAHQRLDAHGAAGGDVELRLVVDLQLVGADGALEVEVEAAVHLGLHHVLRMEHVVALFARGGDVARDVRGHQQLGGIEAVLGKRGDAHAGAQHRRAALVRDGPVERAQQLHRGEHRLALVGEPRQHHAGLLVAQRGDAILGAQGLAQPLDDERHGGRGRGPAQQRLQAIDAAQLDDQHGEPPVGGARDGGLAVEQLEQPLARVRRDFFGRRGGRCGGVGGHARQAR